MSRKEVRVRLLCDLCKGRKLLWLYGKEYVECPQCEGAGEVPLVEAVVTPALIFAVTKRPSIGTL